MARDLKADLAKLETLVQEINEYANLHNYLGQKQNTVRSPFKIVFEEMEELANLAAEAGEEWLRQALAEKERSEQLESLVRELAEALQLYENWEAKVIMDDSLWQSASGLPFITQEVWDDLVAVQGERNKVLHKAKEVLGDE